MVAIEDITDARFLRRDSASAADFATAATIAAATEKAISGVREEISALMLDAVRGAAAVCTEICVQRLKTACEQVLNGLAKDHVATQSQEIDTATKEFRFDLGQKLQKATKPSNKASDKIPARRVATPVGNLNSKQSPIQPIATSESAWTRTAAVQMSIENARNLMETLRHACAEPDFQNKINTLRKRKGVAFQMGRTMLLTRTCKAVSSKFGLGDNLEMQQIKDLVKENGGDPIICAIARKLEALLYVDVGSIFDVSHTRGLGTQQPETRENATILKLAVPCQSPLVARATLKYDTNGLPLLTLDQVLNLLDDLDQGSMNEEHFQEQLNELKSLRFGSAQYIHERQKLFNGLLIGKLPMTMPRYGLDYNPDGVLQLMSVFRKFHASRAFRAKEKTLGELFGPMWPSFEVGEIAEVVIGGNWTSCLVEGVSREVLCSYNIHVLTTKRYVNANGQSDTHRLNIPFNMLRKVPPTEVKVTVKHGIHEDQQIHVTVMNNAIMQDVKEAAAKLLGRSEISAHGRLIRKDERDGVFTPFEDADIMGPIRTVFIVGVDDLEPAPSIDGKARAKSAARLKARRDPTLYEHADMKVPKLSLEEALKLQKDLLDGFEDKDFQKKFEEIRNKSQKKSETQYEIECQRLFMSVHSIVLPHYGFEGNLNGVSDMLHAMEPHKGHEDFDQQSARINYLLRLDSQGRMMPAFDSITHRHFDIAPLLSKVFAQYDVPLPNLVAQALRAFSLSPGIYGIRGGFPYYKPMGWLRYSLKLREFGPKFKDWCVAYHGSNNENIISILADGLRAPESRNQVTHGQQGGTGRTIYLSPCIEYAAHPVYAHFVKLAEGHWAQLVVECRVRPGSFRRQRSTLGEKHWPKNLPFDLHFPTTANFEWLVESPSAIVVSGLMIREFGRDADADVYGEAASRVTHGRDGPQYEWTRLRSEEVKRLTVRAKASKLHVQ